MKKKGYVVGASLLFLLLLIGGLSITYWQKVAAEKKAPIALSPKTGREVVAEVVEIPVAYIAMGEVVPKVEATISSEVNGVVDKVFVDEGDSVDSGAPLVAVASEEIASQLSQLDAQKEKVEASLALAVQQQERTERLYGAAAATLEALEVAEARVKELRAERQRIERMSVELAIAMRKHTITAPFSGIIAKKTVDRGEVIHRGKALLTLYSKEKMQFSMNLPESLLPFVKVGLQFPLTVGKEEEGQKFIATVVEINPYGDFGSYTFLVKGDIQGGEELLPGTFGRGEISVATKSTILVPKEAVKVIGQLDTLLVKEGDVWERRYIRVGKRVGDKVEVLSGLSGGEVIGNE